MTVAEFPTDFVSNIERAVWSRDGVAIKGGSEVRFLCPAHPDQKPSARYSLEQKVWRCDACGAGAGVIDLADKLGVERPRTESRASGVPALGRVDASRVVASYDYTDEEGKLLFQAVRFEPKTFSQRAPDGKGGWTPSLNGTRRVLFNLPYVLSTAKAGWRVYVVEGEKDAEALNGLGLVATTSPMGSNGWRDEYAESLRGAEVVALRDNDEAGAKYQARVARSCFGKAKSIRVLDLPGLPPKGDVSDWIASGGTKAELERLADAAPLYTLKERAALSISAADFMTLDIPNTRWLVDGIWQEHALGFVSGAPKAYKSFLALDLAFAVATGGHFLSRYATSEARSVMYVQMESSRPAFRDRVRSVASRFPGDKSLLRLITNEPVLLEDPAWVERIENELEAYRPSLLILDPLASLTSGDENSSQEMGALIRLFRAWRDRLGCAICVVHHTGKGYEKSGSKRSGEKMRGSSALHGALEAALHVERVDDDTPRINIRVETKEAEAPHPFVCEFYAEGSELRIVGDVLAVTDKTIYDALQGIGEGTVTEITAALGGEGIRVNFVRDRLKVIKGVAIRPGTGSGNKAAVYHCAEVPPQ